jgi:hypothetical protein
MVAHLDCRIKAIHVEMKDLARHRENVARVGETRLRQGYVAANFYGFSQTHSSGAP